MEFISKTSAAKELAWATIVNNPNRLDREEATQLIMDLPEDIIRCKDCKFYRPRFTGLVDGKITISPNPVCLRWDGISYVDPDGYCFRAEKAAIRND